ncbi:MAG: HD-GYP domain-containing protein [Planctomycetes bacterium]|nr:HD-GYP domain-containing protein [Planctomycetota bacterium]MBM4078463.1 HD-GYP domain-containing protein [Planctomycetota bacterium]
MPPTRQTVQTCVHPAAKLAAAAAILSLLLLWLNYSPSMSGMVASAAAVVGILSLACIRSTNGTRRNGPAPLAQSGIESAMPSEARAAALEAQIVLLNGQLKELEKKASALEERNAALQRADEQRHTQYLSNITSLVRAVEAKDHYTAGHSDRVSRYSVAIAQRLNELAHSHKANVKLVKYAAYLHDIGKIHIREVVLNKAGELTSDEYSEVKMHASYTQYILSGLQLPEDLAGLALVASFHHERYEGGGYPSGLPAEYIPIESRIITVADTYDALTSNRPHRLGMPQARALTVMNENAGTQLDPEIVAVFMRLYREGAITRLQYGGELQPSTAELLELTQVTTPTPTT